MKKILLMVVVIISAFSFSASAELSYDSFDQKAINRAFDEYFASYEPLPPVNEMLEEGVVSEFAPGAKSDTNKQEENAEDSKDSENTGSPENTEGSKNSETVAETEDAGKAEGNEASKNDGGADISKDGENDEAAQNTDEVLPSLENELQKVFDCLNELQISETVDKNKAQAKLVLSKYVQSKAKWKSRFFVLFIIFLIVVLLSAFMGLRKSSAFKKGKNPKELGRSAQTREQIESLEKKIYALEDKNAKLEQEKHKIANMLQARYENRQSELCAELDSLAADNDKLEYGIKKLKAENDALRRKLDFVGNVPDEKEQLDESDTTENESENWECCVLRVKDGKVVIEAGNSVEVRFEGVKVYVRPLQSSVESSVKRSTLRQYFDFMNKGRYEVEGMCVLERTLDNYRIVQKGKVSF